VATTTTPMSFAQFEKLPDTGVRRELRNGEPVEMPPPERKHYLIQQRLLDLLKQAVSSPDMVGTEMGFKVGARDYRIADVAYVSGKRWNANPESKFLEGAPELVIEVLSPANTASEIRDKRKLCFDHGSREFWVADPQQREIEVSTPDGRSMTYKSGQEIPLFFAPGRTLVVEAVFL
jgi:Uma2 family endonuclease